MKPCRWCGEQINDSAQKCQNCQTWQRDDADREAQIVDQGIIRWGKFLVALLGAFALIALAAGGFDLNRAHEEAWNAQTAARTSEIAAEKSVADAKNQAAEAKVQVERSLLETTKLVEDVKQRRGDLQKEIDKQRKDLDEQIAYITGQANSLRQDDRTKFGDNLRNLSATIMALQSEVADLRSKLVASQSTVASLSAGEYADLGRILEVQQTAAKIGDPAPDTGRQSYDLVFTICARVGDECGQGHLDDVSRVVYRFDPRWFSVPDVPVTDRATNFSYTLRVWGVTRVRACIFLRGRPEEPILRAGLMTLDDHPSYWGPSSSAKPNECSDLKGVGAG